MSVGDKSDPSSNEGRPLTFAAAALWTLAALFLTHLILAATQIDLVSLTAALTLSYSLAFFAILRIHEPQTSIRHVLALRAPWGASWAYGAIAIVLALLVGAALSFPQDWLADLIEKHTPAHPDDETTEQLLSIATTGKRIVLVATMVVIKPAIDELFFRGAIFTPLRRTQRAETVLIASAAFETLAAFDARAMLSLLGAALMFSWIRKCTGSIFPSIASRMAYFGTSVIPLAMGRDAFKPTKVFLVGSAVAVLVGLAALAGIGRRTVTAE